MSKEIDTLIKYIMLSEPSACFSAACVDENGNVLEVIKDISGDKKAVEDFCEFLNRNEISLVHFYDMFEDYFA